MKLMSYIAIFAQDASGNRDIDYKNVKTSFWYRLIMKIIYIA